MIQVNIITQVLFCVVFPLLSLVLKVSLSLNRANVITQSHVQALEASGVTDGTITDDSDVFLFGGKTVYRRVCSQNKDPEVYTAAAVERYVILVG